MIDRKSKKYWKVKKASLKEVMANFFPSSQSSGVILDFRKTLADFFSANMHDLWGIIASAIVPKKEIFQCCRANGFPRLLHFSLSFLAIWICCFSLYFLSQHNRILFELKDYWMFAYSVQLTSQVYYREIYQICIPTELQKQMVSHLKIASGHLHLLPQTNYVNTFLLSEKRLPELPSSKSYRAMNSANQLISQVCFVSHFKQSRTLFIYKYVVDLWSVEWDWL